MSHKRVFALTAWLLAFALLGGLGVATSQQKPPVEGKGVTMAGPTIVDLGPDRHGLRLRMRIFTVQPGGNAPFHRHKDNPTVAYMFSGVFTEYHEDGSMGKVYRAGDTWADGPEVSHWYENKGAEPVVVAVADVMKP